MYCCIDYSIRDEKWYISFYDEYCEGRIRRNNRAAEYFEDELDANNRVAELMIDEDINFVQRPLEYRMRYAILNKLHQCEAAITYTDCEEYRKQGAIDVLEELINRFELRNRIW